MVIEINRDKAEALLMQVVEEQGPDYVYGVTPCSYMDRHGSNEPSCIVARALFKAGVPEDTLRWMDTVSWVPKDENGDPLHSSTAIDDVAKSGAFDDVFRLDPRALAMFTEAQRLQDQRQPWGDVIDAVTADKP